MEGMTLRELRQQNNKSVAEIATLLGVSKESVYKYESGERKITLEQVLILSKTYEESTDEIIAAQLNSCRSAR